MRLVVSLHAMDSGENFHGKFRQKQLLGLSMVLCPTIRGLPLSEISLQTMIAFHGTWIARPFTCAECRQAMVEPYTVTVPAVTWIAHDVACASQDVTTAQVAARLGRKLTESRSHGCDRSTKNGRKRLLMLLNLQKNLRCPRSGFKNTIS